jgi:hypothetical protein
LGLALLACSRDAESIAAYQNAANRLPASIETVGLADLFDAQTRWLAPERAKPIIELLQALRPSTGEASKAQSATSAGQ